ncbi:photosystem reaction center subunit H [Planomonospora parontospora subsp. parontospora]|uniref:Photosystem reaction center subunit H n=2 Tax=Planomonospora parontospora TaxID=58119 RepID=A0AA37BNR7_9ACTN|nr:PRC and DUF2382 domain-containing protein [Planomonospora parontospora]GGK97225.1 photosystem reaction center subunit H [Planomonospora parontospora]GII12818.1 photosystem reaction center subunit H [Planomonospora parontospora subsp. parontospora]
MITLEQINTVIDQTVYDTNGDKIGDVKHVYLDDATGRPEWLCVKTGLFGTKETFVPTRAADVVSDHIEVSYDKDRVKHAPNVDVDAGGHLSAEEERELYRYYDIDWERSWQEANRPGESGWAHSGGERERERLGLGLTEDERRGAGGSAGSGLRGDETLGRSGTAGSDLRGDETLGRSGTADSDLGGRDDAMTRSEERLDVGTETHETGRARLRKYVVTEEQQMSVPVTREEVRLEREPITDANLDESLSGPEISEAEHEVTLHEERPTVEKKTVPVERVRLGKEQVTDEEAVSEQVRKERIEFEGDRGDRGEPGRPSY